MNLKTLLLCAVTSIALIACEEKSLYTDIKGPTMGTKFRISFQSNGVDIKQLQQEVIDELKDINLLMSTYIPDSEINRFNRLKDDSCFAFSDKTWDVLQASKTIYQQSAGAFDITTGPLISRWGFSAEEYQQKVPRKEEVARLMNLVGTDKLTYNANEQCIRKKIPQITINLSAIAKGYAVDQLAKIIESHDIENYLVDIGGEVKSKGLNPKRKTWTVAVENPKSLGKKGAIVIALKDTSIATSGDYRNYFEVMGKRFSHTINPQTGYPINHQLTSVSVIHPSNMYADAYATAITVLGGQKGAEFAKEYGLAIYTIERDGQSQAVKVSDEFKKYIPKR